MITMDLCSILLVDFKIYSGAQITKLVHRYIREILANEEKCRAISGLIEDGAATLERIKILGYFTSKATSHVSCCLAGKILLSNL